MSRPTLTVGDEIDVSGFVTQDKFIAGRTLAEMERILGFHEGRLVKGVVVVALLELPSAREFDLAGYSQVAAHRFEAPPGLDLGVLRGLVIGRWSTTGPNRLVKVLPTIRHDDALEPDEQYPPGQGAPQWSVHRGTPKRARVVAQVSAYPHGRYMPTR